LREELLREELAKKKVALEIDNKAEGITVYFG